MNNLVEKTTEREKLDGLVKNTKRKIEEHLASGGSIYDKKDNLKYYRDLLLIKQKMGLESIESAYKFLGYEYKAKKVSKEVTLERVKQEIDEFFKIHKTLVYPEKKKPYYTHLRALKRKLNISSTKDIYKLCGYDYDPVEQAKHIPLTIAGLKQRIDEFVANGGSIYMPRRQLPYYDSLRQLKDKLGLKSMEEIYEKCGYSIDREYMKFVKFLELANQYADDKNSIDIVKRHNNPKEGKFTAKQLEEITKVETYINSHATKLKCSPSDFLLYMTNLHYETSMIRCDYIFELYDDLLKAYPSKTIQNIKADHIDLYYRLKHASRYTDMSIKDFVVSLGFDGTVFRSNKSALPTSRTHKSSYVISMLKSIQDAEGEVDIVSDKDLYKEVLVCSIRDGKSLKKWLEDNGIKASHKTIKEYRLSRMKVSYKERKEEIEGIQQQIIKEENLKVPEDEKERYYFNLALAEKTIQKLNDNCEQELETVPHITGVKMSKGAYLL